MSEPTRQMQEWSGNFGKEYTDRNALSLPDMELFYKECYGITRTEMNLRFLSDFDRDMRVLEVGSNIGNQLLCLQKVGFKNLHGIELQSYAVELSKSRTEGINIIQGSAFDIPFKGGFFDLVFTSGLLIHIAPEDINMVLDEMHRCTKQYIWCLECYSEVYTPIPYRGHADLLWKANFSQLFLDRFKDLILIREEHFKWLDNSNNIDSMFLLQKRMMGEGMG
jgi:pseudaminic acid biosynthesis-associated methylase